MPIIMEEKSFVFADLPLDRIGQETQLELTEIWIRINAERGTLAPRKEQPDYARQKMEQMGIDP